MYKIRTIHVTFLECQREHDSMTYVYFRNPFDIKQILKKEIDLVLDSTHTSRRETKRGCEFKCHVGSWFPREKSKSHRGSVELRSEVACQ